MASADKKEVVDLITESIKQLQSLLQEINVEKDDGANKVILNGDQKDSNEEEPDEDEEVVTKQDTILSHVIEICDRNTKKITEFKEKIVKKKTISKKGLQNGDPESVSDVEEETTSKAAPKIKLIPISQLMATPKPNAKPVTTTTTIVIDSDEEDDIISIPDTPVAIKESRTSKELVESSKKSSKSVSSDSKNDSTNEKSVKISLKKLPKNLDKILRKYRLKEIVDDRGKVLAAGSVSNKNVEKNGLESSSSRTEKKTKKKSTDDDEDDECGKKSNKDKYKKKNSKNARDERSSRKKVTSISSDDDDDDADVLKTSHKSARLNGSVKSHNMENGDNSDEDEPIIKLKTDSKKKRKMDDDSSNDEIESPSYEKANSKEASDNNKSDDNDSDKSEKVKNNSDESSDDETVAKKKKTKKDKYSNDSDFEAKLQSGSDDDDSDIVPSRKRKITKAAKSGDDSTSEKSDTKQPKKRRRIKGGESDDSSDNDGSPTKGRKNIRKLKKTKDLEDVTKMAAREELERKKRIEERQKLYNEYYEVQQEEVKELDKLVLDFDEDTKEELIGVDKKLVKKLKPHQGSGIKFMWDTCFETIERIEKGPGSGCILAHCMGLGKTLQVVTLVHTVLTHSESTKVERVLIICPLSTVLNWVNEFKMWMKHCSRNKDLEIFEISKFKQSYERVYQINEWFQEGGVLILGYDMFRNLSSGTGRLKKKEKETLERCLIDPGPDLVVCDEGHLLKNSKTSLSKAVNRLKTLRRIVLTGTPLQNNLNEYYCMVQFVKPNLLGSYQEYLNRFVNPITNGQYVDSTDRDINMMKKRSHILHKMLDGCVQRRDYSVLAPYLPIKHEYVVYITLTELQVQLYEYYIQHKPAADPSKPQRTSVLFQDFQNLQRIWTHPRVLRYNSDKFEVNAQKKRDEMTDDESEGSIKDFIDDDTTTNESESEDSSSSSVVSDDSRKKAKNKKKKQKATTAAAAASSSKVGTRRTRANAKVDLKEEEVFEELKPAKVENPSEWWMSMCPEDELDDMTYSNKLMLLFSLLEECEQIGDKLLVFSQSLYALDVIEHFLAKVHEFTQKQAKNAAKEDEESEEIRKERENLGNFTGSWLLGSDYFRLDGSTSIEHRNAACNQFNRDDNPRARLFLISTRAGGLGINLVAANRVVIFDVSWNPSHDIQSIFRVYRFGQKKPCYVYRFIAMGTMEEKIYERQVTKLAISKRVIDEHQIDRHYKENDLMELYQTNLSPEEPRPTPILPKDRLFAGQLQKETMIYKYHEHDSLLENKSEETLNDAEIKAAWEEFEAEKTRPPVTFVQPQQRMSGFGPVTSNQILGFRSDVLLKLLNIQARKDYPAADENQVKALVPLLLQQLYERVHSGDTTLYQKLVMLQTELEGPNYAFNQMVGQMNRPTYQQNMMINPYALPENSNQFQQQQLLMQAQNRLMGIPQPPTQSNQIIELD